MSRVWFTDRDLGKQFPRILADAGIVVERHGDLFPPDGSDEQWPDPVVLDIDQIIPSMQPQHLPDKDVAACSLQFF